MSERTRSPLGRYDGRGTDETLHEVQLIGMPVQVLAASRQHHDELMREFALMSLDRQDGATDADADVPQRLLRLVNVLGGRYGKASAEPDEVIDAAIARRDDTINVTFVVPADVVDAAAALEALMAEADEFCRAERLLTLERTDVERDFAAWYLGEFKRQITGQPPMPWTGPLTARSPCYDPVTLAIGEFHSIGLSAPSVSCGVTAF